MSKSSFPTVVAPTEKALLERLARGRNTPHKLGLRTKIVLAHAEGMSKMALSELHIPTQTGH